MSKLTRAVTASLRRSWRPLALAGAMIAALSVALGIAMAPSASPPALGGPVTVERPPESTRSGPTGADRPASERERPCPRHSRTRRQTEAPRQDGACSDVRPTARHESSENGALPVPSPTVPAAGDWDDDRGEVDDDEDNEHDDADDDVRDERDDADDG